MITKAIVEEIVSPHQVKVRIPTLDRATSSSIATSKDMLNIATICTLPNCYTNLKIGDVVFVGFEDNTYYKAIVLGHLSIDAMTTFADLTLNSLEVNTSTKLPQNTSIGSVSSQELYCLTGLKDNVQKQIDNIEERLKQLDT